MMAYDVFHQWMQFFKKMSCHLYLFETINLDLCRSFNRVNNILLFKCIDKYTIDGEKQSGHVN